MRDIGSSSLDGVYHQIDTGPAMKTQVPATFFSRSDLKSPGNRISLFVTGLRYRGVSHVLLHAACLILYLSISGGNVANAHSPYPDLRACHSPELQEAFDKAFHERLFWDRIIKRKPSIVVADVTDLRRPKVAWYNPNLMLYAASLPKIAIALGVVVEIDRGKIPLNAEIRGQLTRMIRYSSNRDATALLRRVGMARLAEILQDKRYGKLYDPAYGGGLWVGKEYGKTPARLRDPLKGISHGASAMQAARFYYGAMTGTIIDIKYLPLLREVFSKPAIKHKFVKGLQGRKNIMTFRKSGTWRDYHSDSGVIVGDGITYIAVYIAHHPTAGLTLVEGIRIIDDIMQEWADRKRQVSR